MTQFRVLASERRQRYIYTKTHKNIKEKKLYIITVVKYRRFFPQKGWDVLRLGTFYSWDFLELGRFIGGMF